jgi:DNA-binding NarL/FixJ family response regulator
MSRPTPCLGERVVIDGDGVDQPNGLSGTTPINHSQNRSDTPHGVEPDRLYGFGMSPRPISLSLVNDYDVVLAGVAHMFSQYQDRITVVELDANTPVVVDVDIALYDSFAQPRTNQNEIRSLVDNPHARRVVVYTWNFDQELIDGAYLKGADGYLSKTLPAGDLVDALESIHAGNTVTSEAPEPSNLSTGLDWPGRQEALSERESEIMALITQGKSNAEIAALVYLSMNTIKTYIRSAYRKIGVTNRVEAVLWGVDNGFKPNHHRISNWNSNTHPHT